MFFINVPVGALALVLGVLILLDHRAENAPRSFDLLGIAFLSGAMFSLVWALIKAPTWGWGDGLTWTFIVASVVLFAAFAFWETKVGEPLIPLGLFRSVPLSAGVVLMVLMAIAFMGGLFFVTFYLQNVHGMSPIDAGLHLLPLTGMMIVGSPLAGAAITKLGPRILLAAWHGRHRDRHVRHVHAGDGHRQRCHVHLVRAAGLRPRPGHGRRDGGHRGQRPHGAVGCGGRSPAGGHADRRQPRYGRARRGDGVQGGQRPARQLDGRGPARAHPAQLDQASEAVQVGVAPVAKGTPEAVAAKIADVAHDTFISGMSLASLVAAGVAVVAVFVALLTKRGANAEAGAGVGHI